MPQTTTDYRTMTIPERLALIGEIWDSVVAEGKPIGLTPEQRDELDRRMEADRAAPQESIPWEDVKQAGRMLG
jgi:putative addiction module component (TIGR02574 family)